MLSTKNLVQKISSLAALVALAFATGCCCSAPQQKCDAPVGDCLKSAEPYNDATFPCPRHAGYASDKAWIERTKTFSETAKNLPNCRLVFIGDSITDHWRRDYGAPVWNAAFARFNPLNLGFGNDRTENVLFRLTYGENLPPNVRPDAFVLLIGTNNFGHRMDDPKDVAAAEIKIVKLLRKARPDAHVIVMATFPRIGERFIGKVEAQNAAVSEWIATNGDDKISFLDINSKYLNAEGKVDMKLLPDGLHPKELGYKIWADTVVERLSELGIR